MSCAGPCKALDPAAERRCTVPLEIRATTHEDYGVFVDTMFATFAEFPEPPVKTWSALEMDRGLFAVTAEGRPVGTAAAYSFELTLPGQVVVPAAGVTAVGRPADASAPRRAHALFRAERSPHCLHWF